MNKQKFIKIANQNRTELNLKQLFLIFISVRLVSILLNQTWFVPDEFWQSQEVAHHLVFNYGYLTWEWRVGIRSYNYPLFIAFWYKILQLLNLDGTEIFVYISPIIHSIISSIADLAFFIYTRRTYGKNISYLATSCRLISWFTIYTSSRSLTNTLEEVFTIFCLASLSQTRFWLIHLFGFVSFVIRPTAAINLIPIYIYGLFFLCESLRLKLKFLIQFIFIGFIVVGLNFLIDSYFHGKLIFTWFNFLLYNVIHNVGTHYGTHPWYWFVLEGYPTLLFAHLPLFLAGLRFYKQLAFPLGIILFNLTFYSLLSHKEFRFLSQTMPLAMIVCAHGLQWIKQRFGNKKGNCVVTMIGILNIMLAIVVGVFHQRGPITLMHILRGLNLKPTENSILFLTPCHSTPYYSFLHRNVSMRFLTCEPNINKSVANYLDEADRFYSSPNEWYLENKDELNATHLVLFENLFNRIKTELQNSELDSFLSRFEKCERFMYSFVEQSKRVGKYIMMCFRLDKIEVDKEIFKNEL